MLGEALNLWGKRERPSTFKRWFKVWIKHIFPLSGLLRLTTLPLFFRWRDASIRRGAVIGAVAGAVVRENVPDYGVLVGNPLRLIPGLRIRELNYSLVMLNAPFEAWVGPMQVETGRGDAA